MDGLLNVVLADASAWVPNVLELLAVLAGAAAGALTACERRLDIVGVCTLALITSLGGGLIRDMILSTGDVYMLTHPVAVIGCLVAGVVAFFFSGLLYRLHKAVALFDIISVALFTFSGADKALQAGYGFVACVLMGVLTGVGGGMCRDICLGRIPNIFRTGNLYAQCSVAGAAVYMGLVDLGLGKDLAGLACAAAVLVLRWASLHFNIMTMAPVDLTPHLMRPIGQLRGHRLRHRRSDRAGRGMADDGDEDEDA